MTGRASLILLVLALLAGCAAVGPGSTAGDPREVMVTRVVDGDTIEVRPPVEGVEYVRLIGIDTPETAGSSRGAQPYGEEASEYAEKRLEDLRVTLRFDVEIEDRYGRVLAYVFMPDGSFFNEELLQEGYAQVATFPPNTRHRERFEEAQREARRSGLGIWGLPEDQLCRLTDRGNGVGGGCAEQGAVAASPNGWENQE